MHPRKKMLFEIVLLISSVLVFRALWLLLDKIEILSNAASLTVMLMTGLLATAAVLYYYHRESRK